MLSRRLPFVLLAIPLLCLFFTELPGLREEELDFFVCILSYRGNALRRQAVRNAWLKHLQISARALSVWSMGWILTMYIGIAYRFVVMEAEFDVQDEPDLLVLPMRESHLNLTAKTYGCLKWASENVKFRFLIKTDDDTAVFPGALKAALRPHWNSNDVYMGKLKTSIKVANPRYYVPLPYETKYVEHSYPSPIWPDFMWGGFYVLSADLVSTVVRTPFRQYVSEDCSMGVWMASLRTNRIDCGDNIIHPFHEDVQLRPALSMSALIAIFQVPSMRSTLALSLATSKQAVSEALCAQRCNEFGTSCVYRTKHAPACGLPPSDSTFWSSARGKFFGRRLFILGNAPSLLKLPLHLLRDEATMVFNRFYLTQGRWKWNPTFYVCIDSRVCHDNAKEINSYVRSVGHAFFPSYAAGTNYTQFLRNTSNTHWFRIKKNAHGLHRNTTMLIATQGTVASAGLELGAFLGFSEIIFIGVDMSYTRSANISMNDSINWKAEANDDIDHFDPRYFGKDKLFKNPDVQGVMLPALEAASDIVRSAYPYVRMWNAGIGGSLELYPRKPFRSLFNVPVEHERLLLFEDLGPLPGIKPRSKGAEAFRGLPAIHREEDWHPDLPVATISSLTVRDELFQRALKTHFFYGPLPCGTSILVKQAS